MADLRNCKKCGKMFTYVTGMPICRACKKEEEEEFKSIKEYLYENPGATLNQIASDLDVSVKRIKMYLREGRLEIIGNDEGNIVLECEKCGKSIKTGRYCELCERDIKKGLLGVSKDMKNSIENLKNREKAVGMRYMYKDEKK